MEMIPENLTYIFVNFSTIVFPFLFSFTKSFDFKKHWGSFFKINTTVCIIYILWDILYAKLGVWGFNYHYTIGFDIFGLPLEEILFFICIPFACTFTYYCFRKFVFKHISVHFNSGWLLCTVLFVIIGIINYKKLYTCSAFFSAALSTALAYRVRTTSFIHYIIFYVVILIPFSIMNGILTGSFLERIVVFYNDNENLNFRLLTIPFEDIFYGWGLLLFNIIGFELFSSNNKS